MERTIRPHGLTTLAILNFIFGGFKALGFLFSLAALGCVNMAGSKSGAVIDQNVLTMMLLNSVFDLILAALLVIAGIGYLKLNRISGRLIGNIWALVEIIKAPLLIIYAAQFNAEFNLSSVISFVYPLLTLFFVNIVFMDVWRSRFKVLDMAEKNELPSETDGNPSHLFLVVGQSIRQTLRGVQGILFILLTLLFFLTAAQLVLFPFEWGSKQVAERMKSDEKTSQRYVEEGLKQTIYGFFTWLLDEPGSKQTDNETMGRQQFKPMTGWAAYLVNEKPAVLSLIFAVMTALLPVLASFLAFNQISEDAKRKGFRYLLLRTTRGSIYFGKFIATLVILIPIIILSVAAIAFYFYFKLQFYSFDEILSWSLWAIVSLSVLSVPSVAFCLFFSALINSSFGSLAAGSCALGFFPIIVRLLKDKLDFLGFLQYLHPLKAAYFLYHPEWWVVLLAVAGCALYAAVFAGGGYIYFKRKSL